MSPTQQPQLVPGRESTPPKPVEKSEIDVKELEKDVEKKLFNFVKTWILLPLLGALISAVIIGRLIDWVVGPGSYKIYVVGNISNPEPKAIADAFSGELPKINGTSVEIKELDDSGDPDIAERIASHLVTLNDTLFVVGHLQSTPTQKALPEYLEIANPPVPVILPTETNPNLLPPKSEGNYYPVFRLSPTDTNQAEKAAEFMLSKGATAIWVVEDTSNPVYSRYLAREFVSQIHKKQSAKVLLWTTNQSIPPAYAVNDLGINWVFFAGGWQNALILVRQLHTIPQTRKVNVLLSDGCVDSRLLDAGGSDVENVYLTHPLPPDVYNQDHYAVYGKDAFQLVHQLLVDADQQFDQLAGKDARFAYPLRRLLGLRRVGDARRAISHVMESAVLNNRQFSLSTGQAVFDGNSNRRNASFQVWQIKNHKFSSP